MPTKRKVVAWSWEEEADSAHPTEEEAIEDYLFWNGDDGEKSVTLYGFALVAPDPEELADIAADLGDCAIDLLHDLYGDPDGGTPDIPDAIADAARAFARKAVKHFEIKTVEVVTEKKVPVPATEEA